MLVSIALIYFVAYRGIGVGPLLSESTLEAIALLITIVGAVIFSFPILGEELKQSVAGIILSISGILFSCGVMYFNFKALSDINNMLSLLSGIGGYAYGYGFPSITLNSIWIMFFGFLLLGISGIIGLVTACLPLAISVKQLSARLEAPRPKTPEGAPPKPSDVKYCTKCGASMPLDAIYCLRCGQKQPKVQADYTREETNIPFSPPPPPPPNRTSVQLEGIVQCEYFDGGSCKALTTDKKGRVIGRESCLNDRKDYCCYQCSLRKSCAISCNYLDEKAV
jgi:ribosomal protein L40E